MQVAADDSPPQADLADSPDATPSNVASPTPGQYGETQTHDGVEFVILNDDVLTSVANATTALVHGHALERMAVLYQFPQFLEHCPHDTLYLMVPRICAILPNAAADVQMAAAEALYFVVNTRTPPDVAKHIVMATLAVIASSPEGEVFDAAGEILSMVLPEVARDDVLELVVPATRERATSESAESRRLAARIIGSLNDSLSADEMHSLFLTHAVNLSDDQDETVRAMMAQSLAAVGIKLPTRVSEEQLWPKLLVLIRDENVRVRAAAMRALARSAEAHRDKSRLPLIFAETFKPLFLEECRRAANVASQDLRSVDDDTYLMLEIFSEVYGYLLVSLHSLFDEDEMDWTVAQDVYRSMSACNGPTVRHWCAFNMPAVAMVMADRARNVVVTVMQSLAVDTDVETRATLAAGIKETAGILCVGPMKGEIISSISSLFVDENAQVRMNALGHLSELLALLSPGEEANLKRVRASLQKELRNASSLEKKALDTFTKGGASDGDSTDFRRLSQIFSSLEMMPFDSWRTQEVLAEELRKSAHLVPQQMLCENVAPLLFQMARESTYLVRKASMRALMHVMRYIPDVRRRNHIMRHFRTEWARGQVYWTRLAFIDGAEFALDIVSIKLFNHMFKKELLRMSQDNVANVKTRLLKLFARVMPMWGPLPDFVEALKLLGADADKQVAQEANELLRNVHSARPRTEEEIREEMGREAKEDAFFVHKPKRKKPAVVAAGIVKPGSQAAKERQIGSSMPNQNFKDPLARPVEEQKGIPPSPAEQAPRRAAAVVESVEEEPQPKKPGFFQQIFGTCFGS